MSIVSRHQSIKPQTYARYLDSVRSAGLWTQPTPINPKGILITSINSNDANPSALTWSELIRKFLKHNPTRTLTAQVTTIELALRSMLLRADQANGYDHDLIHLNDNPLLGQSILPPLVRLEDQPLLQDHLLKLTTNLTKRNSSETDSVPANEQNAAKIIISFAHYLLEEYDQCLDWIERSNLSVPETFDPSLEAYDLTLLVIGLTIRGLSIERQGAAPPTVLEAYNRVIEAYDLCLSRLCLDPMDDSNHELHVWAELAIYRTCILSQITSSALSSLESHRKYCSRSKYWPASFRLHKRGIIYKSYIGLLLRTYRSKTWKPISEQATNQDSQDPESTTLELDQTAWRAELLAIEKLYSNCLQNTTSFPRAGSTNHLMLEFCDLLFEAWQLGGSDLESASAIVEMLYEATRKTFQSQKILRYQIRLLDVKRNWEEAESALDLYLQLYTIARTTTGGHATESPQGNHSLELAQDRAEGHLDRSKENAPGSIGLDPEPDEEFVETMIYASRMLIKFLNKPEKASKLLANADEVIRGTQDEGDPNRIRLKSRLARMRGIAAGAQAHKADQEFRPALHASYLEHLNSAAKMDPNSFETMYHLAYAQTELRDIDAALVTARTAVELNPNHTEAWHLLCLLTSASRELKLALDIAEVGLVNIEEADDEEPGMRTPKANSSNLSQDNSFAENSQAESPERLSSIGNPKSAPKLVAQVSTALQNKQDVGRGLVLAVVGSAPTSNLELDGSSLVPSASSPSNQSTKLEFPVDRANKMEANIQLRMTKNVLTEALHGPELALSDQQNLFSFFAHVYSHNNHPQDILQMAHSRSKRVMDSLFPTDQSVSSTPSSTQRLGPRSSRSKNKKGTLEYRLSRSISTRSYISQSLQSQKRHSSLGHERALVPADGATKQDEEKKEQPSNSKSIKTLQDLWLMSAATFRRWGKNDECKGAVEEAESLNPDSPDLWVQFGLYCLATSHLNLAIESLTKAIAFDDQHIPAIVHLSRILKEQGSVELAESLLDVLTQTVAWDTPEAWYLLSEIYLTTDRLKRGKECLLFSLNLEETKPIRPLRLCLPYCL